MSFALNGSTNGRRQDVWLKHEDRRAACTNSFVGIKVIDPKHKTQKIQNNAMMSFRSLLVALFGFLALVSSVSAGTSEEGQKFLAQKKLEDGVVALPSGLMYKELRPGTGKTPTIDSPCKCHYSGTLIDGTTFDSSYQRGQPLTFAPK